MSAGLGLIPGCIGGFAAVSLYTHRLISFGALVAMMICSSGDEAFVILAMIPEQGLILFGILFVIAIISGVVIDKFFVKKNKEQLCEDDYEYHSTEDNSIPSIFKLSSYNALRKPSKYRVVLLVGILAFIVVVAAGLLEHSHDHGDMHAHGEVVENVHQGHTHTESCSHGHGVEEALEEGHDHGVFNILNERWINLLFALFSIITLLFTATAKEHFIKEHLWDHIIIKHLLSVFLWTFGALLLCHIGMQYLDIQGWINNNMLWVILLAVLIGIIPESEIGRAHV